METLTTIRDYYKILIVSQSGKGKTYSFRNMNPKTTAFINIENKPLPFKNEFIYYTKPKTLQEFKLGIIASEQKKEVNCVIIDSISSLFDIILAEARALKKGFDVWNYYNEEVAKILNNIKNINKEVFVTAHYEWIQDENGAKERRVKTKGKEWEGVIEKEFTMVLYTDRKIDSDTKKVDAWFDLSLENSSAKCPPFIFGEDIHKIPNDSNEVLKKILEFNEPDKIEKRNIEEHKKLENEVAPNF